MSNIIQLTDNLSRDYTAHNKTLSSRTCRHSHEHYPNDGPRIGYGRYFKFPHLFEQLDQVNLNIEENHTSNETSIEKGEEIRETSDVNFNYRLNILKSILVLFTSKPVEINEAFSIIHNLETILIDNLLLLKNDDYYMTFLEIFLKIATNSSHLNFDNFISRTCPTWLSEVRRENKYVLIVLYFKITFNLLLKDGHIYDGNDASISLFDQCLSMAKDSINMEIRILSVRIMTLLVRRDRQIGVTNVIKCIVIEDFIELLKLINSDSQDVICFNFLLSEGIFELLGDLCLMERIRIQLLDYGILSICQDLLTSTFKKTYITYGYQCTNFLSALSVLKKTKEIIYKDYDNLRHGLYGILEANLDGDDTCPIYTKYHNTFPIDDPVYILSENCLNSPYGYYGKINKKSTIRSVLSLLTLLVEYPLIKIELHEKFKGLLEKCRSLSNESNFKIFVELVDHQV